MLTYSSLNHSPECQPCAGRSAVALCLGPDLYGAYNGHDDTDNTNAEQRANCKFLRHRETEDPNEL